MTREWASVLKQARWNCSSGGSESLWEAILAWPGSNNKWITGLRLGIEVIYSSPEGWWARATMNAEASNWKPVKQFFPDESISELCEVSFESIITDYGLFKLKLPIKPSSHHNADSQNLKSTSNSWSPPSPPTITNRTMSHIPLLPSMSTFELCKSLFCTVQSCIALNIRWISFLCPLTLLQPFRCGILCRNPCCTSHSNATKNGITLDANNNWKLHCKYFFHCIDRNQIVSSDGRVGEGHGEGNYNFCNSKCVFSSRIFVFECGNIKFHGNMWVKLPLMVFLLRCIDVRRYRCHF